MGNSVNYIHIIIHHETKETKKIRQNLEKCGYDSFR